MLEPEQYSFIITDNDADQRLDIFLADQLDDLSRAAVQRLIDGNLVKVNDEVKKPRHRLKLGDCVEIKIVPRQPPTLEAEDIPLHILYEDDDLVVLNKQPGIVVHPAVGNASHTLVNALLHHCQSLSTGAHPLRPGIVHRLDRDTSGCMVVAKNDVMHYKLSDHFKERKVVKEYRALTFFPFKQTHGTIDTYIDRNPRDRKSMAVSRTRGKRAITHYEVVELFKNASYLRIILETGRTHQIRVHCTHLGHPLIGDLTYRFKKVPPIGIKVKRQMLHAYSLSFEHPKTGEHMNFHAPLPDDFQEVLNHLRETQSINRGI